MGSPSLPLWALLRLSFYLLLPLAPIYLLSQHLNVHNPASPYFFQADEDAYLSPHSDHVVSKASEVIRDYQAYPPLKRSTASKAEPWLQVAIVSVNRANGIQYLDACIGSILRELSKEERDQLHLTTFIADLDPSSHPFYEKDWLWELNDEVWVRRDSAKMMGSRRDDIKTVEGKEQTEKIKVRSLPDELMKKLQRGSSNSKGDKTSPWHQKESLDYTTTLSSCLESSSSKYCLILEDDVVLKRNWLGILKDYVQEADRRENDGEGLLGGLIRMKSLNRIVRKFSATENHRPWVFIRLFFAEKYFGWEIEEARQIVFGCLSTVLVIFSSILLLKGSDGSFAVNSKVGVKTSSASSDLKDRKEQTSRNVESNPSLSVFQTLFLSLLSVPYLLIFILSGRNNFPPLSVPIGLSSMPSRGCCTQALLFKNSYVPNLIDYLEREENFKRKPKDLLAVEWALGGSGIRNADGKVKEQTGDSAFKGGEILAIRPMLAQHIGDSSSRTQKGFRRKSRVWGFGFEREWERENW